VDQPPGESARPPWPDAGATSPPLYEPPFVGGPPGAPPSGPLSGPPFDSAPEPDTGPEGDGSGWRAALIGAVVGAVVAVLIGGGLVLALTDDGGVGSTGAPSFDPANATFGGPGLDVQAVVTKAQPSVVSIETGQTSLGSVFGGAGSGVIISEDGLVLTNDHVISGAESVDVTLHDGEVHEAELVGSFPEADVALIQVVSGGSFVAAELGSSGALEVGDGVLAIGNALNLGGTPSVTQGIVSGLGRSVNAEGTALEGLIQTDTAINPGNSGGPLVDSGGRVVGINTAIFDGAENIGFAIAIDTIKPLIERLKAGEGAITLDTVFLGVSTTEVGNVPTADLETYGVGADSGAFVLSVTTKSAAEGAGLEIGDVIVEVDGLPVANPTEVGEAVTARQPGDEIEIVFERDGERQTVTARLTTRADTND
jgi:putative serine protease PepD